jgi:hypothetical protein
VTFTGNLWGKDNGAGAAARAHAPCLGWFVAGLTLALLTAAVAYIAQVLFAETRATVASKLGNVFRAIGVTLALASVCSFVGGAYESLTAFQSRPQ